MIQSRKGDFTRTGERSIFSAFKDGMKSANRYYLRFKDQYRQLAFEVLQGNHVHDIESTSSSNNNSNNNTPAVKLASQTSKFDDEQMASTAVDEISQNERQLILDCKKQLVNKNEDCYGSWGLINYSEYLTHSN